MTTRSPDPLDDLGPSWSAMSPEQRARYGPPIALMSETERALRRVLELRRQMPVLAREEGLAWLARMAGEPEWVQALGERFQRDPLAVFDDLDIDRVAVDRDAAAAYAAAQESRRPPGALPLWRRELAAGARSRTTFDHLWEAACAEAAGDYERTREIIAANADAIAPRSVA